MGNLSLVRSCYYGNWKRLLRAEAILHFIPARFFLGYHSSVLMSIGAIFQGMSKRVWDLILWRCITGLFAGSPIVTQAYDAALFFLISRLIADCSSTENRNKYLAIMEAVISASSVLGPALGGILGQYSYSLPLYFAGCVAGVAMLFSFFFLQETNKDVRDIKDLKKQMKCQSEGTRCVFLSLAEEKAKTQVTIHEKIDEISKRRNSIHVRPTKLMILCFLVEFCNRWALNSINTRYGTYLLDTFQVSSTTFSYILCAQSAWVCVQQAFIYGLVVRTIGLPIPIVALGGILIEIVGYLVMVGASTLVWSVVGSTLLWIGYAFTAPTSTSIISVFVREWFDLDDESPRSARQSAVLEQSELASGVYFLPACAVLAVLLLAQGKLLFLSRVRSDRGGVAAADSADAERDDVRKDGSEGIAGSERGRGEGKCPGDEGE